MTEPPEKDFQLPENTTAQQLLDEYSDKARAEIAQQQGLSASEFNRHLQTLAKKERVAASVLQANKILQNKPAPVERNENEILAEGAVVRGLKEVIEAFGPEFLSEEEIDKLERQAYAALEEASEGTLLYLHQTREKKIVNMFERVFEARTQFEIKKRIEAGMTDSDARVGAAALLVTQAERTNLNVLRNALEGIAHKFEGDFPLWRGRETREMPELQSIAENYGKRTLTTQESELLSAFVKASKSYYFSRTYPDSSHVLHKYRRMLDTVFAAYRNHGPHKRTSANVSGPAEAFTSHQSEREAGYKRTSKARPHRDPSGGSGENW